MSTKQLFREHDRRFESNRFVYPVVSRRSRGVSIGINLNPDKVCNFDCVYCQVDRTTESQVRFVETAPLLAELADAIDLVAGGELYQHPRFAATPLAMRRLNDLAFSGDGEPTTYSNFDEIVAQVAEVKRARGLGDVKLVLITNASMFHRPAVQRGLAVLDRNQGEIWAKLDAGTERYFQQIDRTRIPFARVLENITEAARVRPLVIQSLLMRIDGAPPSELEIEAYRGRLDEVISAGGSISRVQVYTIARRPAESFVTPLSAAEVDRLVERVHAATGLTVEGYYGYGDTVASLHDE